MIALVALAVVTWRRPLPPSNRLRAAALLWGGWTLVTGLVFSFMSGTMHPYYTVALAPGIAALVGIGSTALWARRESLAARGGVALMVTATTAWSFVLLAGSAESFAWLRWVVVGLAVPAVAGLLVGAGRLRRAALVGVVAALLTGLVGSGAYAVATASVAHTGSIPTVGSTSSAMGGGPGGGPPSGDRPAGASGAEVATSSADAASTATPPQGTGGGMGMTTNTELTALLTATDGTWSAAVATSQTAASLELATGKAVMSTGGWGGSDSAVTLEQFQANVASGQISYYIGGGQGGGPGGDSDSTSSQIAAWVEANYSDDGGRADGVRPAVLIVGSAG